ncbi:MAG: HAD family hydrolase [Defluviitaleaceae bacterium]|nr:HAD family hydrolase [Defluviitaleaceae bacterium]
MIKAVGFDIGNTLVRYNNPLNWKSLYKPAIERVFEACGIAGSEERLRKAADVLTKYNTRENPREREVSSDAIFREIFDSWELAGDKLELAKETFYGFFQADAVCYKDTEETLRYLRGKNIKIGALTDVAYGMENRFSLRDIEPIRKYFEIVLTSVDVGFRKPNEAGYMRLLQAFGVSPAEMAYIGDEEKDIAGANRAGIVSILIDRNGDAPDYGQNYSIRGLSGIRGSGLF